MKKKTILVTGLSGFIGSRLVQLFSKKYNLIDKIDGSKRIDITDKDQVNSAIADKKVDQVIHLAAKTHIDNCEKDKKLGKEGETFKVNVLGTKYLADACAKYDKPVFYLSTECVFDGARGNYNEEDRPNPINWYGMTKYLGEREVIRSGVKYTILRSVLAYGHIKYFTVDLMNLFLNKLIKRQPFKAVSDQKMNITFIDDMVEIIMFLISKKARGIYHYAGNESLSPYELVLRLKEIFNLPNSEVKPISLRDFFGPKSKLRLKNATLIMNKIKREYGISPSNLEAAILMIKNRLKY